MAYRLIIARKRNENQIEIMKTRIDEILVTSEDFVNERSLLANCWEGEIDFFVWDSSFRLSDDRTVWLAEAKIRFIFEMNKNVIHSFCFYRE